MARTTKIEFTSRSEYALRTQKQFDQFGFPFTLNPTVGCSFTCKYCYSPIFVAKVDIGKRKQFFENIRVKLDLPTLLDKQLTKLNGLPQHLKRVQINETSDYYLPKVIRELKTRNRDTMLEILNVFEKHASMGNVWMLHILTKSNLILNHLATYKQMREMVQIEISFATHDENIRNQIEFYTIPTQERLKVIEKFAANDIFVRTMAMPFYGYAKDLQILKEQTFNAGASAFKNKSINYFDWNQLKALTYTELVDDKVDRISGRPDHMDLNYVIKSGESVLVNGQPQTMNLEMPISKIKNVKLQDWAIPSKLSTRIKPAAVSKIDCGYSQISKVNWGYIV
ncbi:MAG: radical SAM protein [Bacteroidota bacterium]